MANELPLLYPGWRWERLKWRNSVLRDTILLQEQVSYAENRSTEWDFFPLSSSDPFPYQVPRMLAARLVLYRLEISEFPSEYTDKSVEDLYILTFRGPPLKWLRHHSIVEDEQSTSFVHIVLLNSFCWLIINTNKEPGSTSHFKNL